VEHAVHAHTGEQKRDGCKEQRQRRQQTFAIACAGC
jgi:hypothetical protein